MKPMYRILLTGISGFLGGHIALQLLQSGYSVLGSVRSPAKAEAMRRALAEAGADIQALQFVELELLDDRGWAEAAACCDATIHAASPFVLKMPRDQDVLVKPAVEGTRRVVSAALAAGHLRIVVTSSVAAVDGRPRPDRPFGVDDWTRPQDKNVNAYALSKTLAEQQAWSIADRYGMRDRLAVINPGTLLGPLLDDDPGTSAVVVQRMLRGEMPMVPNMVLPYVDVRDVARAHVAALTAPAAGGRRHILAQSTVPLLEMAKALGGAFPAYRSKIPQRGMPDGFAKVFSWFDASLRDNRTYLGKRRAYDASSGMALAGAPLIPFEQSLAATAAALISRGLV
jgi:nucleoside-diphosphate-sugar epimerase